MFRFHEGLFECCNPTSLGEPEFLAQDQHISSRAPASLFESASGGLKLYHQKWVSDRHERVRAVVFAHHGETDHCAWFNGLAVRLALIGCTTLAPDAQGYGQSDGARGYFPSFDDLVHDFVEFCKMKWVELAGPSAKSKENGKMPGFVLLGKGIGALVVMRALVELNPVATAWGVTPSAIFVSPAFEFASFIGEQSNVNSCGLNSGQCQRQPAAQCARMPASVAFIPVGEDGSHQKLEHMSNWFPKMIVTEPVEPDMLSRDPETVERMNRDCLCWRQGYRARVLAEMVREQAALPDIVAENWEVFERCPALILHGTADQLYSAQGSHGLHSMWCEAAQRTGVFPRLKIYDGAFHQLFHEPNKEEVLNDIALFIVSKGRQ